MYKPPVVDPGKLKSLEKIYLQRIESNPNSSQSQKKTVVKKKGKRNSTILQPSSSIQTGSKVGMRSRKNSETSDIFFVDRPFVDAHNSARVVQQVHDFDDYEDEAE